GGRVRGKPAGRLGDGRLHIGRGGVEGLAEGELQRQLGVSLRALAGDQLQPVDLHELPLQRGGHVGGHRLGAGSGIVDVDLDHRVVDGRQVVDRKLEVAEDAEEDRGEGEDRGHHRPADERLGKGHGWLRTGPPGVTASWPAGATRSPPFRPCATPTRSPWRRPTVTGRSSAVESSFTTYTKGPLAEVCVAVAGTSTAPFCVPSTRRTLTKRPGQKRQSWLAMVARSFTVPFPSCTALSRKVSEPLRG